MTELRPLLESSSNPRTRELLRAGLGERPPARAVEATALALGVTVSLSASTAGATALMGAAVSVATTPSSIGAMAIVKWLAVGALSGTIVAGGSAYLQHEAQPARFDEARGVPALPQHDAPGERRPLSVGSRDSEIRRSPEPSEQIDASGGRAGAGASSNEAQRSPTFAPSSTTPSTAIALPTTVAETSERTSQLSRELALIDRARASLASGAAEQALVELSTYEKTRTTGTLDREAWILRIDALLLLGQRREARALAQSYLERFPRDAHAVRLLELVRSE